MIGGICCLSLSLCLKVNWLLTVASDLPHRHESGVNLHHLAINDKANKHISQNIKL